VNLKKEILNYIKEVFTVMKINQGPLKRDRALPEASQE
jgi:hypothetical protein